MTEQKQRRKPRKYTMSFSHGGFALRQVYDTNFG